MHGWVRTLAKDSIVMGSHSGYGPYTRHFFFNPDVPFPPIRSIPTVIVSPETGDPERPL